MESGGRSLPLVWYHQFSLKGKVILRNCREQDFMVKYEKVTLTNMKKKKCEKWKSHIRDAKFLSERYSLHWEWIMLRTPLLTSSHIATSSHTFEQFSCKTQMITKMNQACRLRCWKSKKNTFLFTLCLLFSTNPTFLTDDPTLTQWYEFEKAANVQI